MRRRILVIDDESMVRSLIVRVLTDGGYEVIAVSSGRAALDAAWAAEVDFDLVITNTWQPTMSGLEVISQLQRDFPALPILHIDDLPRGDSPSHPVEDTPTVHKPFSIASLREAVRQLLR